MEIAVHATHPKAEKVQGIPKNDRVPENSHNAPEEASDIPNYLDNSENMDQELTENERETESESVNSNKEINNDCKKCDFIAKTKGGLKTHDTTNHKTIPTKEINDAIDRDKETDVRFVNVIYVTSSASQIQTFLVTSNLSINYITFKGK